MRCGAMPLPPRQKCECSASELCMSSFNLFTEGWCVTDFVTVSSPYHPFRFVPFQWGSFFTIIHSFRFEYPSCEGNSSMHILHPFRLVNPSWKDTENAYHVYAMSLPIWRSWGESPWFTNQCKCSCKWMRSSKSKAQWHVHNFQEM